MNLKFQTVPLIESGLGNVSILTNVCDQLNVKKPIIKPVVAVYPTAFTDQTGQRKSNSEFALFSTAITQQPNALLIRALKHAGNGDFFTVVERVGLDNLTKERQLIRSARVQFEKEEEALHRFLDQRFMYFKDKQKRLKVILEI